jgi:hypothetical protein
MACSTIMSGTRTSPGWVLYAPATYLSVRIAAVVLQLAVEDSHRTVHVQYLGTSHGSILNLVQHRCTKLGLVLNLVVPRYECLYS